MSTTKDPKTSGIVPGGGSDRSWYESLDLDGNRPMADNSDFDPEIRQYRTLGAHVGHMAGLNVLNGEPGFHYFYVRDNESDHRLALNRGGEPVREENQESNAEILKLGSRASNDSLVRYNELVLYRMPMAKYRDYQERLATRSEAQLHGSEGALVDSISDRERAYSTRGPSRFRRRDHRIEVRDGLTDSARIHSQWTPDKGIIDEG